MKKRIISLCMAVLMMVCALPVMAAPAADTSWYSDSKTEFTLSTPEQLLGLSKLSAEGKTFKGKTLLIAKDIALNTGIVNGSSAPAVIWTPLQNFAGTIDGQGHSLSGLYATGKEVVGFIATADGTTIKNLSIQNSYFATTEGNTVAAFIAKGETAAKLTVEKCYTDATIVSAGYNGGGFVCSVGKAAETVASECWFDGSITITIRYAAAIIANGEGKKVTAQHCLNTGTVHTTNTAAANSHIGSMVGRNDGESYVIDCLNLGKISTGLSENGGSDEFGVLFGRASGNGKASIVNSAALIGTAPERNLLGSAAGGLTSENIGSGKGYSTKEELTGYEVLGNTFLDFVNYWVPVKDAYPELRAFSSHNTVIPKLHAPEFVENQVRVGEDYGLRFIFRFDTSETKLEDVEIGALVIPFTAYEKAGLLVHDMEDATIGSKTYKVKDVPATILFGEGEGYVDYTACITGIDPQFARYGFVVRPYAKYVIEGVDVYGYGEVVSDNIAIRSVVQYDAADKSEQESFDAIAALKTIYEASASFPMREGWTMNGAWMTIPAFMGGTIGDEFTVGEDRYDLDCNVYTITDTTLQQFKDYLASLQKNGFTLYTDNGKDGINKECYQATLYSAYQTVNVTYYTNTKTTYVTVEAKRDFSEYQKPQDFSKEIISGLGVSLEMLGLKAFGQSMIFQLKNGHFIIVDGAQEVNADDTLAYLQANAPKGQTPVVDAWFFTHAHPDHVYCAMQMGKESKYYNNIKVEGVYYTWPNDEGVRRESAYNDIVVQIGNTANSLKNFKTTDGKVTPQFKLHAGQTYFFAGIDVQVLQTQDQLRPEDYLSYNDSSTSYRFIVEDQELLIMGDSNTPVCNLMMKHYSKDFLSPTFFQSLHHTHNDCFDFFKYIDPQYWVITGNGWYNYPGNNWLAENVDEIFEAGDHISLPYKK